jgi:hypothetical protein
VQFHFAKIPSPTSANHRLDSSSEVGECSGLSCSRIELNSWMSSAMCLPITFLCCTWIRVNSVSNWKAGTGTHLVEIIRPSSVESLGERCFPD